MALAVAKGIGFERVAVIDIDDSKLALAKNEYGADLAVNSRAEDASATLMAKTGGPIAVIDCVGSETTESFALGLLHIAGTYINVGLFGGALHLPLAVLTSRQLSLRGSYVGNPGELHALIEHVRAGDIKPIPIRSAPITEVNEGLAALHGGTVQGRLVLIHGKAATEVERDGGRRRNT